MTVQRTSDLYASNLKTVLGSKGLSGTLFGLGRVRTSLHLPVTLSCCLSGTETKEGPWLELRLIDNSKLNAVYLLNRS
nr:hypothetical protein [Tanacetum cinerariifolium]